jgi:DNA-binding MarR family transcriptional regulator
MKAKRAQAAQHAADSMRRLIRGLRLAARHTTRTGVTSAQLFVLSCLADDSAGSLNDLAERTLTDRSSVATVVDRLVERGLATSMPDPADRRRSVVRITARGRAILKDAPQSPTARLLSGLQSLDDADVVALARGLERLVAAMGLAATPPALLFSEEDGTRPARRRARKRAES